MHFLRQMCHHLPLSLSFFRINNLAKLVTKNKMKKYLNPRRISQIIVVGFVFFLTFSHLKYGIEKAAPIDAYCPFGAVESFLTYLFTGEYLKRIYTSSFVLFGIVFALTILFGRVFCSHLCPLGAIQEWLRELGRKLGFKKDFELPRQIDKYARYLKYVILFAIIFLSFQAGDLVFRAYDPFNALMHLGQEFEEKVFGYLILAILLAVSLFSKSWWCRYFCPLGATLGIIRRFSPFEIKRNETNCIGCGKCEKVCPAGLDIASIKEVNSSDCISCLNCVRDCPKSSLQAVTFGKEISKKTFSWLVLGGFFLALGAMVATPLWQTKAPSNIVDSKGEVNASDIKGSNTLKYLLETTKVPMSEFQSKLGLPKNVDATLKLKEIGSKYDLKNKEGNIIETEDFRMVAEDYLKKNEVKKESSADCPFGKTECEFPGDCGRYVDVNGDDQCDHAQ